MEEPITVEKLIKILQTMPQTAKAMVYEHEAEGYLEVGKVTITGDYKEVHLISQYAVEAGLA